MEDLVTDEWHYVYNTNIVYYSSLCTFYIIYYYIIVLSFEHQTVSVHDDDGDGYVQAVAARTK